MKFRTFGFTLLLAIAVATVSMRSAYAMYFADFAYQNARRGRVQPILDYINKGYSIDATNSQEMTALCQAVRARDFSAYRKLRLLGAKHRISCMNKKVDQETAKDYNRQFGLFEGKSHVESLTDEDNIGYYAAAGLVAAAGGVALLVGNSGSSKSVEHQSESCSDGYYMTSDGCLPIECPVGMMLVDNDCVPIECPTGTYLEGNDCVSIECPDGTHLEGNTCVENPVCETGYRQDANGECVPIVCPPNTHLVGNLCVADENLDKENTSDDDFYGVKSEDEMVFNLYSSPKYPADRAEITLKNIGDGDVYGMLGYGGDAEVFNAYVIGYDSAGNQNEKPVGTASINITNQGSGAVYGIYSQITDITQYKEAINASGWNNGTAYGNININSTGGAASYGVFGDVRAYNAYGAGGGKAYGDITINGDGDIYGIYGYAAVTNAVSPMFANEVIGNINLYSTGDGDVYGMMVSKDDIPGAGAGDAERSSWFGFNAYSSGGDTVTGTINIRNTGNGNVYGMYGGRELYNAKNWGFDKEGYATGSAIGIIKVANYGNGDVYGMYIPEEEEGAVIENRGIGGSESVIDLVNTGSGVTTGMRGATGVTIVNSGEININNLGSGTAVGIYGESNSIVNNSGTISIYRSDYTDTFDNVVHKPDGTVGGTAYGIYAESGAQVTNSGTITISGAENGSGIYLEKGATLENNGTISFNGASDSIITDGEAVDIYGTENTTRASVDLSSLGGEIILGSSGKFFAESLSGNMSVSANSVLGSMKNEYVLDGALQANDVSDLAMKSKSAMFSAKTVLSENDSYDVVLTRENFNTLLNSSSVAEFFEENYEAGNGEALYDVLKKAETESALEKTAANLSGTDVIPNFSRENAVIWRNLNRQFNDNLFNEPDKDFIGGYKYIDVSSDTSGTLSGIDGTAHAAYGMAKKKADNGVVYGLGATVVHLESDYDNGASRKSNTFGLWAPAGYDFGNGTRWFSKLYAGYGDGSYDRLTDLGKYSADITEYQYGLANEVRYNMALPGGFRFEPAAELNLVGSYLKGFNEGSRLGALDVDGENSLSLEGGLGAYLSKEFDFEDKGRLGIQIGGIYYVEFLDPYDGFDASMALMNGKYKLANKSDDSRAVLSARINYSIKDIMLYGALEKETGNNKAFVIDAGVQYKF